MTRCGWLEASCAALALAAGTAGAAEVDMLSRRVAKYANEYVAGVPGKYPCVCQDGGDNHAKAGFTHQAVVADGSSTKVATFCMVFEFDAGGESTFSENCIQFVSLAR
jgi:hypothetical protein